MKKRKLRCERTDDRHSVEEQEERLNSKPHKQQIREFYLMFVCMAYFSVLKMKAVCYSETSTNLYQTIRCPGGSWLTEYHFFLAAKIETTFLRNVDEIMQDCGVTEEISSHDDASDLY
jgi:hypothetical protein